MKNHFLTLFALGALLSESALGQATDDMTAGGDMMGGGDNEDFKDWSTSAYPTGDWSTSAYPTGNGGGQGGGQGGGNGDYSTTWNPGNMGGSTRPNGDYSTTYYSDNMGSSRPNGDYSTTYNSGYPRSSMPNGDYSTTYNWGYPRSSMPNGGYSTTYKPGGGYSTSYRPGGGDRTTGWYDWRTTTATEGYCELKCKDDMEWNKEDAWCAKVAEESWDDAGRRYTKHCDALHRCCDHPKEEDLPCPREEGVCDYGFFLDHDACLEKDNTTGGNSTGGCLHTCREADKMMREDNRTDEHSMFMKGCSGLRSHFYKHGCCKADDKEQHCPGLRHLCRPGLYLHKQNCASWDNHSKCEYTCEDVAEAVKQPYNHSCAEVQGKNEQMCCGHEPQQSWSCDSICMKPEDLNPEHCLEYGRNNTCNMTCEKAFHMLKNEGTDKGCHELHGHYEKMGCCHRKETSEGCPPIPEGLCPAGFKLDEKKCSDWDDKKDQCETTCGQAEYYHKFYADTHSCDVILGHYRPICCNRHHGHDDDDDDKDHPVMVKKGGWLADHTNSMALFYDPFDANILENCTRRARKNPDCGECIAFHAYGRGGDGICACSQRGHGCETRDGAGYDMVYSIRGGVVPPKPPGKCVKISGTVVARLHDMGLEPVACPDHFEKVEL